MFRLSLSVNRLFHRHFRSGVESCASSGIHKSCGELALRGDAVRPVDHRWRARNVDRGRVRGVVRAGTPRHSDRSRKDDENRLAAHARDRRGLVVLAGVEQCDRGTRPAAVGRGSEVKLTRPAGIAVLCRRTPWEPCPSHCAPAPGTRRVLHAAGNSPGC
jgi:hypothetical protein